MSDHEVQRYAFMKTEAALARLALQRVRALRKTRKQFGVNGIHQHITDVEGDWLEMWELEAYIDP